VNPRRAALAWGLLVLPVPLLFLSLALGRYGIGPGRAWAALFGGDVPDVVRALILRVRLPRALAAAVVGVNLSVAGVAFQGVFRNPLVESRILGVSSGAGLGAALALLAGGGLIVQPLAFALGLSAAGLVALIGWAFGGGLLVLVVSGVLVDSFLSAILGLIKYVADPLGTLPAITYWLLGGLSTVRWADLLPLGVASAIGLAFLLPVRWRLNLLALGEGEATALGVRVGRFRLAVIAVGTLLTAAAVSVSGVVGWVGLIVPHAARALIGPDHMYLIPAAAGLGASVVLLLDTLARTALPTEIPLGVLTGLIGVPVFLVLFMRLLRRQGGWR
jgi:iron complex transport system permease protein